MPPYKNLALEVAGSIRRRHLLPVCSDQASNSVFVPRRESIAWLLRGAGKGRRRVSVSSICLGMCGMLMRDDIFFKESSLRYEKYCTNRVVFSTFYSI